MAGVAQGAEVRCYKDDTCGCINTKQTITAAAISSDTPHQLRICTKVRVKGSKRYDLGCLGVVCGMEWRVFGHHPSIVLSGRRRCRQGRDKFGTVVIDVTHRNDELQKTSHTAL